MKKMGKGLQTLSGKLYKLVSVILKDTAVTSWELIKITIPVIIVTKILQELGVVMFFSKLLDPVMGLLGLPGAMGLVWATAMITNLYGAMAIFAALAPGLAITTAQATIICSAMLVAHSLPLEMTITKRSGAPLLPILVLRIAGGFLFAWLLDQLFTFFSLFQGSARIVFEPKATDLNLGQWALGQIENLMLIVVVIFCVIVVMRFLRTTGILDLFEKMLEPVLPFFGMSKRAAPITVVGMLMGISYGGALIIRESTSGRLKSREVFFSLALMALCHAIIEDTLLMMALGAHWTGVFLGRVLFSLIVIYILAQLTKSRGRYKVDTQDRMV